MEIRQRAINKKVIIAIPCLMRGGTEMQTLLLVRALVALEYDVDVCCYFEYDQLVVAEFKASGAKIRLLDWPRTLGTIAFIQALARIFRDKSPDMVHVQYMAPGLLPIIAAKFARVPLVLATVHYPGTPHGFVAHLLLRFGAFLTDCFTCVSEAAEKSWFGDSFLIDLEKPTDFSGRRHLTIPNALDVDVIDKALATELPRVIETALKLEGKIIVGTVARLSREKGIDNLLKAFASIKKKISHSHLLIVGDGNQRDNLQSLARQLGIDNSITWMGQLSWVEAVKCMSLMHVVIVPSRFEGFGLTAVEAMACGKPVAASNVDGLSEIIEEGISGLLINSEDSMAFAKTVTALLKDEKRRKEIGISARRRVQQKYSYLLYLKRVKALYGRFLGSTEV